jgi:hypothetical protein
VSTSFFWSFLTGDDTDHADETDGFVSFFNAWTIARGMAD